MHQLPNYTQYENDKFIDKNELNLSHDELLISQRLERVAKFKTFNAKDIIYQKNQMIDKIFIVNHGMIKLLNYLPNGRSRIVRLYAKGHWIGLEGLVEDNYSHTAVAVGEVEVNILSLKTVREFILEDPNILAPILSQWMTNLHQADKWISEFSTGEILPRVARLLKYIAELEHSELTGWIDLLTVNEIADILGVTPESVSRVMASFKRNEILRKQIYNQRKCYQVNIDRLQKMAEL